MENAGHTVAQWIARKFNSRASTAVICGGGNNGGDGYVAARWLHSWGWDVHVYLAVPAVAVRGDALVHLEAYRRCGGSVESIADDGQLSKHWDAVAVADVVVDCLFGTGLTRPVTGHFSKIVDGMNQSNGSVVAVDIPSGLCADTGAVLGNAVRAHSTVTMAFLKPGIVGAPGFTYSGEVHVADIGIPEFLAAQTPVRQCVWEIDDVRARIPPVDLLCHKNRRGRVVVIGGSAGKRGAPQLSAWAALRSGAGIAVVATDEPHCPYPPVMTAALDPAAQNVDASLRQLVKEANAVVLGPGMVTDEHGAKFCAARVGAAVDSACARRRRAQSFGDRFGTSCGVCRRCGVDTPSG